MEELKKGQAPRGSLLFLQVLAVCDVFASLLVAIWLIGDRKAADTSDATVMRWATAIGVVLQSLVFIAFVKIVDCMAANSAATTDNTAVMVNKLERLRLQQEAAARAEHPPTP